MEHIKIDCRKQSVKYKLAVVIIKYAGKALFIADIKLKRKIYNFKPIKKLKDVEQQTIAGLEVFVMNKDASGRAIIYFHGGGYIESPLRVHYSFAYKLAKQTNSPVYFVRYPLVPMSNALLCCDELAELLGEIPHKNVILMGDSAGGSLSVSLAHHVKGSTVTNVEKIVSICPWLDITLSNPEIEEVEKKDGILVRKIMIDIGKLWQHNLEANNPLCSPLYAKLDNNLPILMISASNEILNPDIKAFCQMNSKHNIRWYEFMGLHHDFPLFTTKESRQAFELIKNFVIK